MDNTHNGISRFSMIDVGRKRVTRRRAIACGSITVGDKAFQMIKDKALPKGDALSLAEIAGIYGAKKTPELLPMCHILPLDKVQITCSPAAPDKIDVIAQVTAHAKTGVEMEAIVAVQSALACIWDLVKMVEPNLTIGDIRLLLKEGGKSGMWIHPDGVPDWLSDALPERQSMTGKNVSIVIMSDRASSGEYDDKTGPFLTNLLDDEGADIISLKVIPDEKEHIEKTLIALCDDEQPDIILAAGGTGPGPRDITPDVVNGLADRELDGLGEVLRRESAAFTDTAWLSRMGGYMRGRTLIVTLPGSPKAVGECWDIIRPFISHALDMIAGQGHGKSSQMKETG